VVQVGRGNVYGHPSATVLARLAEAGALVLRTDLDGRIVATWSAGGPLRLGTARPRRSPDDGMPALFSAVPR
jgi:competence protein ComEC